MAVQPPAVPASRFENTLLGTLRVLQALEKHTLTLWKLTRKRVPEPIKARLDSKQRDGLFVPPQIFKQLSLWLKFVQY